MNLMQVMLSKGCVEYLILFLTIPVCACLHFNGMSVMYIYINDQKYELKQGSDLNELFSNLNIEVSKGIAVAVNDTVIPKREWNTYKINSEDKIILIKATQGG